MATISYVNNVLPVGGQNFNPGIEEVLDRNGNTGVLQANLFEITNNDPGPFQGFKVQFTSNVNGTGDFSYVLGPNVFQPFGTITGMFIRAPNGTVIAQVTTGAAGFYDAKLDQFYNRLIDPGQTKPIDAVLSALNNLFNKADVIFGSPVADHLTNFGGGMGQINAGAGDDILTSFGDATMVGEAGNDFLRVSKGTYNVHGANADGSGGPGETNTLEIRGSAASSASATIAKVTDIDILRFVDIDPANSSADDDADLATYFNAGDIKSGGLSPTLKVFGSEAASPFSENSIDIRVDYDATAGVTVDLSGWTFANWDESDSYVNVYTSTKLALADVIVGSKVGDSIYTGAGNDIIRGGLGADSMGGGDGNDTFVFGAHEVAPNEYISGDDGGPKDTDRMLVLGDNDFSEAYFGGIETVAFGGTATATFNQYIAGAESDVKTVEGDAHHNTLAIKIVNYGDGPPAVDLSDLAFTFWSKDDKVTITGTKAADTIAGSVVNDVIDGGLGNDDLQGNEGADAFTFNVGLTARGVDHIADFHRKEGDMIGILGASFPKLKAGKLSKSAFEIGLKADDKKDHVLYDNGTLRFDDDGTGKHKAHVIAVLDDSPSLKAGDILLI